MDNQSGYLFMIMHGLYSSVDGMQREVGRIGGSRKEYPVLECPQAGSRTQRQTETRFISIQK
jgi:hypothetical protein